MYVYIYVDGVKYCQGNLQQTSQNVAINKSNKNII